jgi:hypothetical protein
MQPKEPTAMRPTCGAPTRAGTPCGARPTPTGRCRQHATAPGQADDHRGYGRGLAERRRERAEAGEGEAELLSLRDEIMLVDGHTNLLLELLEEGPGARNNAVWRQIQKNIDLRRRLVEAELKRQLIGQQHLSAQEAITLVTRMAEAVKRHVHDDATLGAIAREFEALTRV